MAFNWQKLPWFVLVPVLFWSFVCSQAAPESAEKIKADIRENGGVVVTRHEIGMILFNLIQYPTFLAAAWILWGGSYFPLAVSTQSKPGILYLSSIPTVGLIRAWLLLAQMH